MTAPVLTLGPDAQCKADTELAWENAVLAFVPKATQAGQTVVVSAEDTLFTPQQAAQKLMVSRSTISRRITAGQIRSIKVGNRHRIPWAEVQRAWNQSMAAMAQLVAPDIEADLFGDASSP